MEKLYGLILILINWINGLHGMTPNNLDKHIRCKCGKLYGIEQFRRKGFCRRCKTLVIARGDINKKKTIQGDK